MGFSETKPGNGNNMEMAQNGKSLFMNETKCFEDAVRRKKY
jgi:ribosomal protein L24E